MNEILFERLKARDEIEKRFSNLFVEPSVNQGARHEKALEEQFAALKAELESKDRELDDYKMTLKLKNKDAGLLHDEIITLTIENNLLQDKLEKTKVEYDKIVQRWLDKVQQEADNMNKSFA